MLELDILEQRPLNPLESSVSRTVTPTRWPVLHVPFIHEFKIGPNPILHPGNLDQVALQVNVQEPHCSLTEVGADTKIIPELVSCARRKDIGELFVINSAVMLDTVEKVTPMEICDSAQNMLQESGESSNLQIREDFFEITIARDLTDPLHRKDGHNLNDPVSEMNDEAAGMEAMGTGAVLQSEQSERVGNLPNEPNRDESSAVEASDTVKVLTEMGNLEAAKTHASVDESPEEFLNGECTAVMSSHQRTANNTRDGDPVKCLEAEHLPCLQSTSTQEAFKPIDFPEVTTSFHETSVCKALGFTCVNEVRSATCLSEKMEPNTDNENAPKENVPRDKDLDISIESIRQQIETTTSNEKQDNDMSVTYLSETNSAKSDSVRLQDVQSDTSELGLYDKPMIENDRTLPGNVEDLSFEPNLPLGIENVTGAKALDTEECSFSSSKSDCNTPVGHGAADCPEYTCANSFEQSSDPRPGPLTILCGESSYSGTTRSSSVDCCETPFIDFNSHIRESELDGETKEQLLMSVALSKGLDKNFRITEPDLNSLCLSMETEENRCTLPQTVKFQVLEGTGNLAVAQSQGHSDMLPSVINNPNTSLKVDAGSHCLVDSEDWSCRLSGSDSVICDVTNCDEDITTSHTQSNLFVSIKESVSNSDYLKVPCQTVGYCTDETPSCALVPYIDIWASVSKSEVNSFLSLRDSNNFIRKTIDSQEQKEDKLKDRVNEGCILEEVAEVSIDDCIVEASKDSVEELSHYRGKSEDEPILDTSSKMDTLVAQEVKCNVSAVSSPCHAECHNIKMHDNRISSVPSTINLSDNISRVNSSALCDSFVALDVHNICALPDLVDVRCAVDTLQSEQTSACFLKEKSRSHLSLSNKHLHDSSAIPTSLPACTVAVTESKNRERSCSEVLLGNLRLNVTNHTDHPVSVRMNQSKSPSLKQDIGLGPRQNSALKEPFKSSDSVRCMQILATEVKCPTQSAQSAVTNEHRSPVILHMDKILTPEVKPSTVKAVVAVKPKATRVKSLRSVFNAKIKIHEKSLKDCPSLKESPRQSTDCHMEMLSATIGNRKKYNLRPSPQSLNCSASQEAKRPKIYNGRDIGPASSGPLNCVDKFSQKSESHSLSQPRLSCKRKEPPSAIRNGSCLSTNISIKRQPNRKCKNLSIQENLTISSKTCESSPVLKIDNSHNLNVEYKSLPSKHVDLHLISKPYSKMTRGSPVSQNPTHLMKCTQDQMLLNKLSRIANRLTAPSKSETFSSNLKLVPFHGVKIRARKLLNVFSCVSMRMNAQPGQMWQENVCLTSSRDRLVSQSMNLYPKTYFSSLGDTLSLNSCNNLTFPVSFHVNVDPSCLSDFLKFNPPDFILRSPPPTAQSSELSEWTLSLFLSSHMPADTDNVHPLTQWNPQFRSLKPRSESSNKRESGCSMRGLHTVLALSSPGCYRLWTRKRNLGSRIPTVQKLSVTQFAHGLKGSPPQLSRRNDQFSSLAFSLGRVLSTWSRHGLSAFSSDCANAHPNCSVWLPSQSSSIISVCRSPNPLVCVPQLPQNTIPQLTSYSFPVQNLNSTLIPRVCHQEDLGPSFSFSTQLKDDSRPPFWLSSHYKDDVESSCSFIQEDGPKQSLTFCTVKEDNLNLPLDPSTHRKKNLDCPLGLSSLKPGLKPVVNVSLQKVENPTICLDSRDDLFIQEDATCPESPPKRQACPFEQREGISIPCIHSKEKDQGDKKGSIEKRPQRVSQIRIRKTIPKPDPNLTPMGLPKPKRENKKEFSLEDIYTNKNYKSPPPARSLETIFEEPKEKNGVLISVSQQKRKRILEFRDCTVPRLKRPKGKMKVMTSSKRGRKAAMEGVQLDALLIQKLMDLENCLLEEEAMERSSAASEMPS